MTRPERSIGLPGALSLLDAATPVHGAAPAGRRTRAGILLLNELIKCPRRVGSVCPSSRFLARQMAATIDVNANANGLIVELGGGTGIITESLLRHGVTAERLIVIEQSARMAQHLARRFPRICVVHGDAASVAAMLAQAGAVAAVISSLPLRSLPKDVVSEIAASWVRVLQRGARVAQFTYAPFRSSAWLRAGLQRTSSVTVWANLPPARVEVFRQP